MFGDSFGSFKLAEGAEFTVPRLDSIVYGNAHARGRSVDEDGLAAKLAPKIIRIVHCRDGRYKLMLRGVAGSGIVGFVPDGLKAGDVLRISWVMREVPSGPRCFRAERVEQAVGFDDQIVRSSSFAARGGHSLGL